mgnify:CR=1 FL=1
MYYRKNDSGMIIFSDDVEYNRVTLEHSAWADGFTDVLSYGHTSDDYDNPYHEPTERVCYDSYKAGASAAESYTKHLEKEVPGRPKFKPKKESPLELN